MVKGYHEVMSVDPVYILTGLEKVDAKSGRGRFLFQEEAEIMSVLHTTCA